MKPTNLHLLRLLLSCALLTLAGCAGTNTRSDDPAAAVVEIAPTNTAPTAADLILEAGRLNPLEAAPLLLQAAALYLDQSDLVNALETLDRIDSAVLTPTLSARMLLERAEIAMARDLPREALTLLQTGLLPPLETLDPELQVRVRLLRANAQESTGAVLGSALERIEVDALLKENPPKGLTTRRKSEVIVYKED